MTTDSNYIFLWSNFQSYGTVEFNFRGMRDLRDKPFNRIDNVIKVTRKNIISCFHSKADIEKDKERGKKFLDRDYVKQFMQDVDKAYKAHQDLFKAAYATDMSSLSDDELFDWFLKLCDQFPASITHFRATQEAYSHYLTKTLRQAVAEEQASLLMLPTELDTVAKELMDWQVLIKQPFNKDTILAHARKYPWLVPCHYHYDDVIETLKQRYDYDKTHLKPHDLKAEKAELKARQQAILDKHPEIRPIVHTLQELALSRIALKSCWAGTEFFTIPIYQELAKRTGESAADIWRYYLIDEVKQLLKGTKLTKEEKQARDNCFVGLWKDNKMQFFSGDKAEQVAKQELGSLYEIKQDNTIKGACANPGKVQGTARVLSSNDVEMTRQFRKDFKQGQILFTQMTQPNIMDIASKAAAIVTDEGGMLSHAAIISRELRIPCIVGTHFGTRKVNDGDTVEVDADNATVNVIKRV
jgi:phosphohistidine swiveling domain-containing protein